MLCKGVTYNRGDVKLEWFRDADCTQKITEWAETDEDLKFSVSYADGADGAEVMTIAMTASGLAEINGSTTVYGSDSIYSGYSECYVRITYAGTVNSDATVVYGDDGNPNEVSRVCMSGSLFRLSPSGVLPPMCSQRQLSRSKRSCKTCSSMSRPRM